MGLADSLRRAGVQVRLPKLVLRPALLLCPNVPKPMHGVAPREVLGSTWWDATRQAAYRASLYRCVACGVWKGAAKGRHWLEGHEVYEVNYAHGRMRYLETVALCHYCHNYIHDGRLAALLDQGRVSVSKFVAIVQHGDRVLAAAGLHRPTYEEREAVIANGTVAAWGKWRLELFGKLYPPKYKTYKQWQRAYGD